MDASERDAKLVVVRRQLLLGLTWHEAAKRGNIPASTAYKRATKLWPHLAGRRPRIDAARRADIVRAIQEWPISRRAIARIYSVSPDTVCRFARRLVDDECRADGIRSLTRQTTLYRCDGCRSLVTVRPCLICAARGNIGRD